MSGGSVSRADGDIVSLRRNVRNLRTQRPKLQPGARSFYSR
jgi:hypothetical protein